MVKETHPSTFAELVSISGLSHGTDVWLGNAAELVQQGHSAVRLYLLPRRYYELPDPDRASKPELSFTTMESVRKGKGLKPRKWKPP